VVDAVAGFESEVGLASVAGDGDGVAGAVGQLEEGVAAVDPPVEVGWPLSRTRVR